MGSMMYDEYSHVGPTKYEDNDSHTVKQSNIPNIVVHDSRPLQLLQLLILCAMLSVIQ